MHSLCGKMHETWDIIQTLLYQPNEVKTFMEIGIIIKEVSRMHPNKLVAICAGYFVIAYITEFVDNE